MSGEGVESVLMWNLKESTKFSMLSVWGVCCGKFGEQYPPTGGNLQLVVDKVEGLEDLEWRCKAFGRLGMAN